MYVGYALWCHGAVFTQRGDLSRATPILERALRALRASENRLILPGALTALGWTHALAGRTAEAGPILEEAVTQSPGLVQASIVVRLAEGRLRRGAIEDARQLAGQALDAARRRKERGNEAYAQHALGEIAACAELPDVGTAATHYEQALALAESMEMRPLIAHCHLGLGKLQRRAGLLDGASEHLRLANAMYREMDMRFGLEQAGVE